MLLRKCSNEADAQCRARNLAIIIVSVLVFVSSILAIAHPC